MARQTPLVCTWWARRAAQADWRLSRCWAAIPDAFLSSVNVYFRGRPLFYLFG